MSSDNAVLLAILLVSSDLQKWIVPQSHRIATDSLLCHRDQHFLPFQANALTGQEEIVPGGVLSFSSLARMPPVDTIMPPAEGY